MRGFPGMQLPDTSSFEFLHREWPVIKAAPYSFCASVAIAVVIGWGVIWWIFRSRIERFQESIEHLERDKDRLKEQLQERAATVADVSPGKASVSAENSGKIEVNPVFNLPGLSATPPPPPTMAAPVPPRKRALHVSLTKARIVWLSEGGADGVYFFEPEEKQSDSSKALVADFRIEPQDFSILTWHNVRASILYFNEHDSEVAQVGRAHWLEERRPTIKLEQYKVRRLMIAIQAKDAWIGLDDCEAKVLDVTAKRVKIVLHDDGELSCNFSLPIDLETPAIGYPESVKPPSDSCTPEREPQ